MMKLADLRNDRFRGTSLKLPLCLMVKTVGRQKDTGFEAESPVLFIKSESLKLSSWLANGNGKPYTHTYNDNTTDTGLAFDSPRIHLVASSPRLVEVTKKGFESGIGRKGAIIGNYETEEGRTLREKVHPKEYTTLRTLHMIFLVDEQNNLLHKIPLVLSIHGGGAAILGKQLEMFYRQLEVAYSEHENLELIATGQQEQFFTLNEQARAIAVFEPELGVESVGEEQKSKIPAFIGYKEPTPETVESLFNFQNSEKILSVQSSLSPIFAQSYLRQFQQYHPVGDIESLQLTTASQAQPETFYGDDEPDFDFEKHIEHRARVANSTRRLKSLDYDPQADKDDDNLGGF